MHPALIIEEVERAGGQIIAEGGRLRAGLPKTPDAARLRKLIALNRDDIIRWLEHGNDDTAATKRAVVRFKLRDGGGGQVIDPDGLRSAVSDLMERFGDRVDGDALLEWLAEYAMHDPSARTDEAEAALEAAEVIRRARTAKARR
ncbi:hypothetical protein [Crenobacter cavernae]|uniref:TubC N-terminal docking domain-containing protein n=1 Tax=Crenobacter cavernae TaxID=2290923 RepID=A0A345Y7R4_9NEIS|nr:hypothetical protein [Crenobacter cavernae]AXK39966.1 hypothetical protein DWG20_11235 [Crenobacter cavernae]